MELDDVYWVDRDDVTHYCRGVTGVAPFGDIPPRVDECLLAVFKAGKSVVLAGTTTAGVHIAMDAIVERHKGFVNLLAEYPVMNPPVNKWREALSSPVGNLVRMGTQPDMPGCSYTEELGAAAPDVLEDYKKSIAGTLYVPFTDERSRSRYRMIWIVGTPII